MKFSPPRPEVLDRAVALVVSASETVFGENLECIILKGSAVKGDFIQGYSDFDFNVFLKPVAMESERVPKVKEAIRFQKAFGAVNPEDFGASQFQIYFISSEKYPPDWVPPVEGTYRVFWGSLPSSARELKDSVYLSYAKQDLKRVEQDKQSIVSRFVDKPNRGVPPVVRLLGATMKGHMHSVSTLLTSKPKVVHGSRLDELILFVEDGIGSKGHFTKFFECISDWTRLKRNYEYARRAFREGIRALDEIARWSAVA